MKRWTLKPGATDLSGLVLEDVAIPEPGPGEVRIRVRAASLNYRDQLVLTQLAWRTDQDIIPVADGAGESRLAKLTRCSTGPDTTLRAD